ncbi:alpha/beta-hydrolase [Mycena sanguinolenta]|nr:alpha/beta-hydrolase [Mycena sanguinolenta]
MDQSNYKQTKTKRGFTYSYYYSAPAPGKPVLFFAHGFPSPSFVWSKQVAFFKPLGYGLIAPDLLGYGGTDKPTDAKMYIGRGMAEDMADILDAEGVANVVVIGHDWGSYLVSRMWHYFPQRVLGITLLGVGYMAADGANPFTQGELIKSMVGYDVFAYMRFFVEPDASEIIEKNMQSFISLLWPETPAVWKENMCADGGTRAWIEGNKITRSPSYLTAEEREAFRKSLLRGGMTGPCCWYRLQIEQANLDEDAKLPPTARDITQPLLFVAFNKDCIALPAFGDMIHGQYAKGLVTRKEIDADHWGLTSHAAEVNEMVLEWVGTLKL